MLVSVINIYIKSIIIEIFMMWIGGEKVSGKDCTTAGNDINECNVEKERGWDRF